MVHPSVQASRVLERRCTLGAVGTGSVGWIVSIECVDSIDSIDSIGSVLSIASIASISSMVSTVSAFLTAFCLVLGSGTSSGVVSGSMVTSGTSVCATSTGAVASVRNNAGKVSSSTAMPAATAPAHAGHKGRVRFALALIIRVSSSCRRRLASVVRLAANSSCNSLSSMAH